VALLGSLIGVLMAGAAFLPPRFLGRMTALAAAAVTLAVAGLATSFVFGEDDYIGDGSSRWSNRDVTEHRLYVVAMVVVGLLATSFAALAARPGRPELLRGALFLGGIVVAIGSFVVAVAFGAN
jgi:hypothetical protein